MKTRLETETQGILEMGYLSVFLFSFFFSIKIKNPRLVQIENF